MSKGELVGYYIAKSWRFIPSEMEEWVRSQPTSTRPVRKDTYNLKAYNLKAYNDKRSAEKKARENR